MSLHDLWPGCWTLLLTSLRWSRCAYFSDMALNAWLAGWDCFGMGSMGRTFRCCEEEGWQ